MYKKTIPFLIIGFCITANAETTTDVSKYQEAGKLHVAKYDNYQCRGLRDFLQNTGSVYRMAYKGQKSLKSADEFSRNEAIDTIIRINKQELPLPFNASFLLEEGAKIRNKIFNDQYNDSQKYLDDAYSKCVSVLSKSAYSNSDNYDRKIDYSKGEDKIPRPKITKVEQVCDSKDFPELMAKARTNIKDFASARNLTTEKFLSKINYQSINRLAEDMLQAGLDEGLINVQFLLNVYNAPGRGLRVGHLKPRCPINQ
jgi:hypothetical protein